MERVLRRRFLIIAPAVALTATGLAACGQDDQDVAGAGGLKILVNKPWVRTTVGKKDPTMTAAFMDLTNPGTTPVKLTKASCEVATKTELHVMETKDGKKVMVEAKDGILIEPESHKHLLSGGAHIMLMGLKRELPIGDEVTIELTFDNGQTETIKAMVKEFVEEDDHYHTPLK